MLENHQSSGGSLDLMSLVVPRGDFKALLYNAYGCGLGFVAWAGFCLLYTSSLFITQGK